MAGCGPSAVTLFHDTFLVTCYDDNSINRKRKDGSGFLGPNDFGLDSVGGVYFTASGVWDVSAPAQGAVYYIPSPTSLDKVITENIYQVASESIIQMVWLATLANTVYSYQIYKICTEQETPQFGGARILKFREDGTLIGTINFKSPFRNHTNVWVDGTTLYATATTEIDHANGSIIYPGVVMSINDPKLKTRKELDCTVVVPKVF
ncbi:hypothetical protein BCR33DRAFT_715638 [Rhizoclosmatium globosum]|uniref:SMP-30/Gluconolactonase/LRE-like region domain-containing protein n=1 Tax=Rhizoclosmatium globosum TaxID=329046 RepID=A0A1Y2CHW2_9FUNG|nr:hypothetical protein BCR33DRAFT_715638 [Rhizoclosmatium globosum]|eukprot:ORY46592.1 hypothetical protein BCR33DRAFT_715638 [Rhizoclosmatium globosum]